MTEQAAELRRAALDWLARRDYSRAELTRKLRRKFGEDVELEALFGWLEEHRFLDESRYLDILIRSALDRGHGLLRLRQDLRQRGLPAALVDQALGELDVDWFEQARQLRERRFGPGPVTDPKEKARQLRYLQYRGFTTDQCLHALPP